MKKTNLILSYYSIFFSICIVTGCCNNQMPGPSTTVRGFVKEAITGKPVPNVQLQIVKHYSTFGSSFMGGKYAYYDIVTTSTDGSYSLKFTPKGTGTFDLLIVNPPVNYSFAEAQPGTYGPNQGLKPGQVDTLNFSLARVYNVKVHLKNNSNQNRTAFHYFILDCCSPYGVYLGLDISPVVIDTVINYKLPQLTWYTYQSIFYKLILSGANVGGFGDSLSFKKTFYINQADTGISIVNP